MLTYHHRPLKIEIIAPRIGAPTATQRIAKSAEFSVMILKQLVKILEKVPIIPEEEVSEAIVEMPEPETPPIAMSKGKSHRRFTKSPPPFKEFEERIKNRKDDQKAEEEQDEPHEYV